MCTFLIEKHCHSGVSDPKELEYDENALCLTTDESLSDDELYDAEEGSEFSDSDIASKMVVVEGDHGLNVEERKEKESL